MSNSRLIKTDKSQDMINAMRDLRNSINDASFDGLFEQRVIIDIAAKGSNKAYTIDNREYDCEFDIPFSGLLDAKTAEIIIYNLPKSEFKISADTNISVRAGYGEDIGLIFSGKITNFKTKRDDLDRVTTIKAVYNSDLKDIDVNLTYTKRATSSYILRDLLNVTKRPIYLFKTIRDSGYTSDETIDGSLLTNINRLADICGVTAFYFGGMIYVCPFTQFQSKTAKCTYSYLNGLIDINEWSDRVKNGKYIDEQSGYDVTTLLDHQVNVSDVIKVNTGETEDNIAYRDRMNYATKMVVVSGSHEYDGEKMVTKIRGRTK